MRSWTRLPTFAMLVVLAGCAAKSPTVTSTAAPPTAVVTSGPSTAPTLGSIAPNPLASAAVDGAFEVDATGRRLAMQCWGTGSPAVFLETGGGGLDELKGSTLVRGLAAETEVCIYNRAGSPPSDPAPNVKREAEDYAADLHALIRAAGIKPPLVLWGRSFGGMLVTFYASIYPDDVAGVVVYDSPAPSATMTEEEFPEGVWDYPGNTSRLDVLYGFENRFGKKPVHIEAPLILISPTGGESEPEDTYWLQVSDDSKQVVLADANETTNQNASKQQILSLVLAARG